jgi:hypothetical protein
MTTRQFSTLGISIDKNEQPMLLGSPNDQASLTLDLISVPQISIGYKGKVGSHFGAELTIDVPGALAFTGEGRVSLNGKFKGKTTVGAKFGGGVTVGFEAEVSGGMSFSRYRPAGFDANGRITGGWTPELKNRRDTTTKYGRFVIPREYGEKIGSGVLAGVGFSFKEGKFAWVPAGQLKRSFEKEHNAPQAVKKTIGIGVVTVGYEGKGDTKAGAFNMLKAIQPALQGNKLTDSRTGKAAEFTLAFGGKFYVDFPLPTPWGVIPTTIQLKANGTVNFSADGESKIYIVNPFNRNAKLGALDLVKLYKDVHQELKKRLPFMASEALSPVSFEGSITNLGQAEQFANAEILRRLQYAQQHAELSMAVEAMRTLKREDLRLMEPETLARLATAVNHSLNMLEQLSLQEIREKYPFIAAYLDPTLSKKSEWLMNEMDYRNDQMRGITPPEKYPLTITSPEAQPAPAESRQVTHRMRL